MKDFQYHTAEELAADASFSNWVLRLTDQNTTYWEEWVLKNADRQEMIAEAKNLVLAVHGLYQTPALSDQAVAVAIRQLVSQADQLQESPITNIRPLWKSNWVRWQVAAAALILLVGGLWFSQQITKPQPLSAGMIRSGALNQIERRNTSNRPMTILLSDGSVVTLNRDSRLTYPRVFGRQLRSVTLVGEAFFEVSKNPAKPFLVFTDRSVTKVLGTSFRIRAFAKEPNVNVIVRTGKVAVYALDQVRTGQKTIVDYRKGVLLLPNQQAEMTAGHVRKSVVKSPGLAVATQVGPSEITFDDQPVAEVLLTLSRLYEIHIDFNDKALENCRITTSFAEETLPERLSIICRAINATYTIDNDKVEVSSNGCSPNS